MPHGNCGASKAIADATGAEVVSVYNRTEGGLRDGGDAHKV